MESGSAETFVLVHSPSVGPSTWTPVAEILRDRGHAAVVPSLVDIGDGPPPYWPRIVDQVVMSTPPGPLTLVAHSNAGLFVPLLVEALRGQVSCCLFVDAALPPRQVGTVRAAEPEFLPFLTSLADGEGILPRWTDWWASAEVARLLPDEAVRKAVVVEQPRLPLVYYLDEIPVPIRWDHVSCAYLWFGEAYAEKAAEAGERGWPVERIPGEHLHQVVDPAAIAEWVIRASHPD
jgi:hypothetical protein